MAMIGDQDPTQHKLQTVSAADRARINNALDMVFAGLTLLHWIDGGKLIHAWRSALKKMRPIGFDIPGDAPIVVYLRHANFHHRRKWEQKIIASRNGDDHIQCPPDKINEWRDKGNAQVRDGMELIRQTVGTAVPVTRTTRNTQNAMTRVAEYLRSREHEREYERERTK